MGGEEEYAPFAGRIRSEYRLGGRGDKKPLAAHLMMRDMEGRGVRPAWLGSVVGAILADGGEAAGGPA